MSRKSPSVRAFLACLWAFVFLCPSNFSSAQDKLKNTSRPAEFTAADPDIRALLDESAVACDETSANERFERLQKAVTLADKRGLIGDRALTEALLASAYVSRGELELGFATVRKAMQDSVDAKNEVLEADTSIAIDQFACCFVLDADRFERFLNRRVLGSVGFTSIIAIHNFFEARHDGTVRRTPKHPDFPGR